MPQQEAGQVQMLGIIQEQHPNRCRLFMQWKQMDWPIMVDPLNSLGVSAVPLTYLIDEHGIVRKTRARPEDLEAFLAQSYDPPQPSQRAPGKAAGQPQETLKSLLEKSESGDSEASRRLADYLVLWGQERDWSRAIGIYRGLLEAEPDDGRLHFRLGVALRKRFDSSARQRGDFAKAVESWGRALEIDPNQYIWRRRIQQYGPRLDKPYPFYDWVNQARREIKERGEEPAQLAVEPGGAEFAQPAEAFQQETSERQEPDPLGRINRDQHLVGAEKAVVPARPKPGESVRVHIILQPNQRYKAHWNNEVEDLVLWVDAPAQWKVSRRYHTVPRPPALVSQEPRPVEFEVEIPQDARGRINLEAYALYYVCEDVDGTCLYRRHDLTIPIAVR